MICRWRAFSSCLLAIKHTCSMFCHIVRKCGVRHLVNGPSLISNRRNSLNNRFHVLRPLRLDCVCLWPATSASLHLFAMCIPFYFHTMRETARVSHVCYYPKNHFRTQAHWAYSVLARIPGRKYLLQLTTNPVCVPFQTIPQCEGIQSPSAGRF